MQSICVVYNIFCLKAVTVVDGFNTGDVDGDAIWNKTYTSTFFLILK